MAENDFWEVVPKRSSFFSSWSRRRICLLRKGERGRSSVRQTIFIGTISSSLATWGWWRTFRARSRHLNLKQKWQMANKTVNPFYSRDARKRRTSRPQIVKDFWARFCLCFDLISNGKNESCLLLAAKEPQCVQYTAMSIVEETLYDRKHPQTRGWHRFPVAATLWTKGGPDRKAVSVFPRKRYVQYRRNHEGHIVSITKLAWLVSLSHSSRVPDLQWSNFMGRGQLRGRSPESFWNSRTHDILFSPS